MLRHFFPIATPICPAGNDSTQIKLSLRRWWNYTDSGNDKYWEKRLTHCRFVHHKSYVDWPGIEPGQPPGEVDDKDEN